MFGIKTLSLSINQLTTEIKMDVQKIIDQLKNFKPGINQADLDAVINPIKADLQALKDAEAADAEKFTAIQAALDANTAGDMTEEQAIQAIADAVAPV